MGRVVGIDLGTTYSAVAVINDLGKPEILLNREGENITPSVVMFQGDMPIVGTMAKRSVVSAPLDVVQFVKRYMGDPTWKFETTTGEIYSPEEISALILKRLKEDAELTLGEGSVTDAIITVPAYFDDARRRATIDAGTIAGLNVRRVLNEPTAAALAYGLDSQVGGTILVYDLGGGTFDVTLIRIGDGVFDVLATDGDRNLGGFDWDNELMNWLNTRFMEAGGPDLTLDDGAEADLRDKAEMAKRSLTTVAKANVALSANGVSKVIQITRDEFNEITAHLLSRSRDLTESAVEDAQLSWSEIDRVLLVGGSTRMPAVREMVETLAGKPAERTINPDEVVALGAALQAYLTDVDAGVTNTLPTLYEGRDVTVSDVTSQSLGVVARNPDTGELENTIIIPRNWKIPSKASGEFSTIVDNQTELKVEVTQGDDVDLDYVTVVGTSLLRIPPYPANAPIEVIYSYDIDQTIHIEVKDLTAGQSLGTFEIDAIANMSTDEVKASELKLRETEVG